MYRIKITLVDKNTTSFYTETLISAASVLLSLHNPKRAKFPGVGRVSLDEVKKILIERYG